MEAVFIKAYVLISLWFWAGMLLSKPLRKAFHDMHWRVAKRIYDVTWGRLVKTIRKAVASISKRFKATSLYVEDHSYELRAKVARSLVSKELLEELASKNLIAAISRARRMERDDSGLPYEDLEKIILLAMGKQISREAKETAVKRSFDICDTGMLKNIMAQIPRTQERILLAFDQIEGRAPYDSIKNEEYRKFIRE